MAKKQKVVLKFPMEDAKKHAKAMQCVAKVHDLVSVSHEGDEMTVVGEGFDSVALTKLLRKKMGDGKLVMVTAVEEKKEAKKEEEAKNTDRPLILPYYYGQPVNAIIQPPYYYTDVIEPGYDQNICSIM